MANLAIDLDLEAVQYDGEWLTRQELARKIKASLEAGDYAISRPSQALEYLTQQLTGARTLYFKVTGDVADSLQQLSVRDNRPPAALLRDALAAYLNAARAPVGRRPTEPEMPAVVLPQPQPPAAAPPPSPVAAVAAPTPAPAPPPPLEPVAQPSVIVAPMGPPPLPPAPGVPIAGPGALRAAQPVHEPKVIIEQATAEEAAAAVEMKPKPGKQADLNDEEIERRWFGR